MSESLMHLYRRAWEAERIRSFALRSLIEESVEVDDMFNLMMVGYDRLCYEAVFELQRALKTSESEVYVNHWREGLCSARHETFALDWVEEVTGERKSKSDLRGKGDWLFRLPYGGEFLDSAAYDAWQVSVEQFQWGSWGDVREG